MIRRSWWQTGPLREHTPSVRRPSVGQLLRQLVLLALGVLLWGGGFSVFLSATGLPSAAPVAEALPTSPSVPTSTPTLSATATPRPASTATTVTPATPTATSRPTAAPTIAATGAAPLPADSSAISFQRDVQPIFNQICVKCHGGEQVKEGLSLKTYAEMMQGSNNGAVIVPGDPANSLLVDMIQKGKMPKRGPKLLPRQIQVIVDWITAGAPDN